MTTANKVTLVRIALIPVFVTFAIYYGISLRTGAPCELFRWAAVSAFALAAASDGLDGFIARRFNQRTALGAVLDPVADKGLLLAGIVTLSFSGWSYELPVWFAVLVVARDLIVMAGALILIWMRGKAAVKPVSTGKAATALQMVTLIAVMLQAQVLREPVVLGSVKLSLVWLDIPMILAAIFTLVSGLRYSVSGMAEMHAGGHGDPSA